MMRPQASHPSECTIQDARATQDRVWFAIFLAPPPKCVVAVGRYAAELGIESYAPRRKTVSRVQVRERGRKPRIETRITTTSLLGRYLLVQLPRHGTPFGLFLTDSARRAGVTAFVGTVGQGPTRLPDAIVAELQDRERRGEFDATVKRGRRVLSTLPEWCAVGSHVRITAGAFRGFTGIVEEHAVEGRVNVAVSLFGRVTPLEIAVVDLTAETPS